MTAEHIVGIVVVVGLAVAGLLYWLFNAGAKQQRALRDAIPRPISELGGPSADVCIAGKVVADRALTAPSGASCVVFRTKISRPIPQPGKEGAGPRWAQVAFQGEATHFSVDDGSGKLRVLVSISVDDIHTPLGEKRCLAGDLTPNERALLASGEAPRPGHIATSAIAVSDELRVQERLLRAGDEIIIIGNVRAGADGKLEMVGTAGKPLLMGPLPQAVSSDRAPRS